MYTTPEEWGDLISCHFLYILHSQKADLSSPSFSSTSGLILGTRSWLNHTRNCPLIYEVLVKRVYSAVFQTCDRCAVTQVHSDFVDWATLAPTSRREGNWGTEESSVASLVSRGCLGSCQNSEFSQKQFGWKRFHFTKELRVFPNWMVFLKWTSRGWMNAKADLTEESRWRSEARRRGGKMTPSEPPSCQTWAFFLSLD